MIHAARKRRKDAPYFSRSAGDPAPLVHRVKRRVVFSDADPMGVLWHGRYPAFFETAAAELHRLCGLGYADFHNAALLAPIVRLQVDYLLTVPLDEEVTIEAALHWNEAARIDTAYAIIKPDGRTAARGFTIQLFTPRTGELLLASPEIWNTCRRRWMAGEFAFLQ
jgi:acyl-CoA thioester hydrolase